VLNLFTIKLYDAKTGFTGAGINTENA